MKTSAKLLWDEIQSVALSGKQLTALSGLSAVLILAFSAFYDDRRFWLESGEPVTDSTWDDISKALAEMELEVMGGLVGMIIPHALADISGINWLACDGSQYARVDYPKLYDAIDPMFHVDADNFLVPDMRDKFPLAEGVDFALGDTGGETEHTLDVSEMPSHSHTNAPHNHTEVIVTPSLAQVPLVPVPSAIPAVGVTGLASIGIDPTGGDAPHNNMPPYIALRWAIVCDA